MSQSVPESLNPSPYGTSETPEGAEKSETRHPFGTVTFVDDPESKSTNMRWSRSALNAGIPSATIARVSEAAAIGKVDDVLVGTGSGTTGTRSETVHATAVTIKATKIGPSQ